MPYSLAWTTYARDKSARLWMALWMTNTLAARRFSDAVNWIDQNLKSAPQQGQRRTNGFVMRRDLVEVAYTCAPVNYTVTITDIDLVAPNTATGQLTP
jgi:hypothetical protein